MSRAKVDWPRARRALDGLDAIVKAHPELVGPPSEENRKTWEGTLMKQDAQFAVRLSTELAARVDAFAERLRAEQPGPAWKRSDVVRLLLARALDAAELELAPTKATKTPTKKK